MKGRKVVLGQASFFSSLKEGLVSATGKDNEKALQSKQILNIKFSNCYGNF